MLTSCDALANESAETFQESLCDNVVVGAWPPLLPFLGSADARETAEASASSPSCRVTRSTPSTSAPCFHLRQKGAILAFAPLP